MKKALSLLLTVAMLLSLCACGGGNTEKVSAELTGTWTGQESQNILGQPAVFTHTYKFSDASGAAGSVELVISQKYGGETSVVNHMKGAYEVKKGTISLSYIMQVDNDGSISKKDKPYEEEIKYTYKDDVLSLTARENEALTKK